MKNPQDIADLISEDVRENNGLLTEAPGESTPTPDEYEIQKRIENQGEGTISLSAFVSAQDGWTNDDFRKAFAVVWNALASDESVLGHELGNELQISSENKTVSFRVNGGNPIIFGEVFVRATPELLAPNPPESDDINTSALYIALQKRGYR